MGAMAKALDADAGDAVAAIASSAVEIAVEPKSA
jgi:hypothetical protein